MSSDPILDFLEQLPIEGMTLGNKLVIYAAVISVLLASLFTLIATRKRSGKSTTSLSSPVKANALKLDDDKIMALKIELDALYIALDNVEEALNRNKLSNSAYYKLQKMYENEIRVLEDKLNEFGIRFNPNEFAEEEQGDEEQREEEKPVEEVMERPVESKPTIPSVQTPPATQPPVTKPVTRAAAPATPSVPPVSPPPARAATPPTTPSIPKPAAPAASKPSIPAPRRPNIPPPVSPTATPPAAVGAQNPLAGEKKPSDDKFAQSTSIAALRSDMLRELARLRKFIDESDED